MSRHFAHYAAAGLAAATAALCTGCGSGATTACGDRVPAAVAAVVGAHDAQGKVQNQSSGYASCVYRATSPHGGAPEGISVIVENGPRAYVEFTTTIAHLVQFPIAGESPQELNGIGRDADWVPGPRKLLAATGRRFVTVKILAHGSGSPSDLEAAKRVARAALR